MSALPSPVDHGGVLQTRSRGPAQGACGPWCPQAKPGTLTLNCSHMGVSCKQPALPPTSQALQTWDRCAEVPGVDACGGPHQGLTDPDVPLCWGHLATP